MTGFAARHPVGLAAASVPVWIALYLSLQPIADSVVGLLGPVPSTPLTEALRFFVFEVPKVLLLLILVVFVVGVVRTYFSPDRTRDLLGGRSLLAGNALASLLGVVTPFCSCSAIPLFIGFVKAGVPLGVTFSFLIAAPMVNEVAVVLLAALFGWQTSLLYLGTGLVIAFGSGHVIGQMHMERFVEGWVNEAQAPSGTVAATRLAVKDRALLGFEAVKEIVGKVWPYLLLGIGVGAGIHGYVPEDLLAGLMGRSAWWSVPVAVLIGVPLYSNAAGIVPIVEALLGKGAALGTALAFMMSVIGLSLPEIIILRKVVKLPLILAFVGVVAAGIMIVGFLFNAIL